MLDIIPHNLNITVYNCTGVDDWGHPVYESEGKSYSCFMCPNSRMDAIVGETGQYITFEATITINGLQVFNPNSKIVWIDEGNQKLEKTIIGLPQYVRDFGGKTLFTRVRV